MINHQPNKAPPGSSFGADLPVSIGIWTKLLFGLGQTVEIVKIWVFETLVLFFYSQVIGLSPALAGSALLIAMAVDAFTDPLIGELSDRSENQTWGRRHHYMFGAILPAAAFIILLFSPHPDWGDGLSFAWMVFTAVGVRVSLTFFAIPYSAQMADLSVQRSDRASLTMFRMLSGTGVRYVLILFAFDLFFAPSVSFASGQEDYTRYLPFSLFAALLIIVFGSISALGTFAAVKARTAQSPLIEPGTIRPNVLSRMLSFWFQVLKTGSNLRTLLLYSAIVALMTGVYGSLTLYFGTYYWNLTPKEIGLWAQLMLPGMVGLLFLGQFLLKFIEPKNLLIASVIIFAVSLIAPVLLAELGVFTRTDPVSKIVLYTAKFANGCAFGGMILCVPIMASEVADEWQHHQGRFVPALIFGALFFTTKAGGGLGSLLAGLGLEAIRFPDLASIKANEALLTARHIRALGTLFIVAISILTTAMVVVLANGYQLPKSRHRGFVQPDSITNES